MASVTTDRLNGVTASLGIKAPARAATTGSITLSGLQTVDNVALSADDRVLVKDQTDGTENGIYDVKSGAWVRSLDFNGARDIVKGTLVIVVEGSTHADTFWRVTSANDAVIGTDAIIFAVANTQLSGVSAFMQTVLDDGSPEDARATLGAGTGNGNGDVTLTGAQTLTNKTMTSPVLNTGVSGTAVLDEDNMASDSATKLATQQSIKAYVDAALASAGSTPPGTISAFAGTAAPTDWVLCDGSAYDVTADASFSDLFNEIGTVYGGTGNTDFQVPDLRGRVIIALDNLGGSSANRMTAANADSEGGTGGAESITLSASEIPAHTHEMAASQGTGIGGGLSYFNDMTTGSNDFTGDVGAQNTSSNTGGGGAHANDQPWMALAYIIKK